MITDRDLEQAVRAWIAEGSAELPDPYLDAALAEVATTPQRQGGRLLRTFPILDGHLVSSTVAAVTIIAAAIAVLMLLPRGPTGTQGASPTPEPTRIVSPTPAPTAKPTPPAPTLASGRFKAVFGTVRISATGIAAESGSGANVSGSMDVTASAEDKRFSVELQCARSEPEGILLIGGSVIESTHPDAPVGSRVAIAFQAGDPVLAILWFEGDTLARSCSAFLRRAPGFLDFVQPIEGDLELAR